MLPAALDVEGHQIHSVLVRPSFVFFSNTISQLILISANIVRPHLNKKLVSCEVYSGLMASGASFVKPRMALSMKPGSGNLEASKK